MKNKKVIVLGLLSLLGDFVCADPAGIIAGVICALVDEVIPLARSIAIVMFIYGGGKYAYSADDPGGRKQGKNIAMHAIIGMVIVQASKALVSAIGGSAPC